MFRVQVNLGKGHRWCPFGKIDGLAWNHLSSLTYWLFNGNDYSINQPSNGKGGIHDQTDQTIAHYTYVAIYSAISCNVFAWTLSHTVTQTAEAVVIPSSAAVQALMLAATRYLPMQAPGRLGRAMSQLSFNSLWKRLPSGYLLHYISFSIGKPSINGPFPWLC